MRMKLYHMDLHIPDCAVETEILSKCVAYDERKRIPKLILTTKSVLNDNNCIYLIKICLMFNCH